jgi:hypothetical protein
MSTYEQRLNQDLRWALREGSMHFDKSNTVHQTLQKVARKLDELGVAYAVVGGMAMFYHGYRRFTEDVDILVSRDSLKKIQHSLTGRGYIPLFEGSKNLRDADTGVRIEFLVAGEFPGDGKPKSVSFPDPAGQETIIDGIRFISIPKLFELKLASGLTGSGRVRDLGDAQDMMVELSLPRELGEKLDPFVRDKYFELWDGARERMAIES